MVDRFHDRMPYSVHAEFRTTSSFLVAYSVNLSRGGVFLETTAEIPAGAPITVDFEIPSIGQISLNGTVAWRRDGKHLDDPEGPPGIGVEFLDIAPQLGAVIDQLVSSFHGIQILILSGDRQDRTTLVRSIKSIISTAELAQVADAGLVHSLLTADVDLAVIDLDFDLAGGLKALDAARTQVPPVPTIALTMNSQLRDQARAAGATEVIGNPPPFAELQVALVRALSKPKLVRQA